MTPPLNPFTSRSTKYLSNPEKPPSRITKLIVIWIQLTSLYPTYPIHTIKLIQNDSEMFFFFKWWQVFLRTHITIVTDGTRLHTINLVKESINSLSLPCFAMFFIINGIMHISTDCQNQIDRELTIKNCNRVIYPSCLFLVICSIFRR